MSESIEPAINEILRLSRRVVEDENELKALFTTSGIVLKDDWTFQSIGGDSEACLRRLLVNLSVHPVAKIAAKKVLSDHGVDL
ncbi:MAG: hypothetical protein G3M78_09465 [Candidatus Nitrohelix vancouverensis]|uniref:Uncharacterized protein n=1 Tax=Candidatus Nitrohelix vancouverensis TaxID=2705534 RepID=A0A7T0C340_9BACT|nr:MAG: hypothetical protein G3M78_09465 [Candidatus Nitrohelix vancouverensis]